MMRADPAAQAELFDALAAPAGVRTDVEIAPGAWLLRGFAFDEAPELLAAIERDFGAPIVSVSLGVPATFLWGGMTRAVRPRRVRLEHGDVVVWGGPARLTFHGIDPLRESHHPMTGSTRFNLTCRRAR